MKKLIALVACLVGAGCAATVGTGGVKYVPKDAASTCSTHCAEIGLALNSVVIMASNVGCVCSAAPAPGVSAASGASAGGMAAILMAEEAQQRNASSSQSYRPPPVHH